MTKEQKAYFSRMQDKALLAQGILDIVIACMADAKRKELAYHLIDNALELAKELNVGLDAVNLPEGEAA